MPLKGALRGVLVYGLSGGVLIVALRFVEYRFLVIEHSFEIYGAIIAALFAAVGIWLGVTITREKPSVQTTYVGPSFSSGPSPELKFRPTYVPNAEKIKELGLTPRELEILNLIAEGLSTKQMAERIFVSENTVKTHCSRVFDKLGVNRRTQAVQVGKQLGLVS